MGSPRTNSVTKTNTKRRKIEMKEVEQINKRYATFSKRKLGLFNKLTELSILCQEESALIITSPNGKLYSCGYPDANAVIRRYLTRGPPQRLDRASKKKQEESIEALWLEYETTQNHLKEKKERLQMIKEIQEKSFCFCFPSWWNVSTEDMSLENLEEFKISLERLKFNLVATVQEKQFINSVPPMSPAIVSSTQFSNVPPLTKCFNGNQVQDYWKSDASAGSVFPVSGFGFGHY